MRVLIAGCGYIGIRVADRLHHHRHDVYGLRRNPPAPLSYLTWCRGDLSNPSSISLPPDLDVVILAAGLRRDTEEAYERLLVTGYHTLLNKLDAEHSSVQRIILISTTGVFAEQDGGWVNERSPVNHVRSPGRYYLEAEKIAAHCGRPSVIMRLAGIYGPERVRLIREVRGGQARIHPPPAHYLNQLHADDAAGAIVHVTEHPKPEPLYVVCDREPADRNEVVQWISDQMNLGQIPPANPDDERPARRAGNKRGESSLLVSSGYTFDFPTYREGYKALIHT